MKKEKVKKIFEILHNQNPNARIELHYTNAFTLLIAVVLSAQATDIQVNKITPPIFEEISTPQDLINKGEAWLFEKVKSINYNKTKAANLYKAAIKLESEFGGKVPDNREALQTLAGVGRKSANVILNSIFHCPTMPVDTHVFRVANRTGLVISESLLEVEENLVKIIPPEHALVAHHLLVLHGRYICKALKPGCQNCKINHLCQFKQKTT